MALKELGVDFEHYRVVEFDKYAIASYNSIHGTDFPVMDVTKIKGEDLGIVEKDKYCYILTYSFPCTDLSLAGRGLGMAEGSGTRSSLLWEVRRLLDECEQLPQVLVMENVPQVHSKKNMPHFQKWLNYLEGQGYANFWKDMNAKNFGVAQSRNRTICVSVPKGYIFNFPEEIDLNKRMKDYLEESVPEKFYLKNDKARILIDKLIVDGKILRGGYRPLNYQSTAQNSLTQQIASQQSTTTELVEDEQQVAESVKYNVYMNYNKVDNVGPDVAKTLCARDYKGFGTGFDTMNGVIECQRLKSSDI